MRHRLAVMVEVFGLLPARDRRLTAVVVVILAASAGTAAATGVSQRWLVDSAVLGNAVGLVAGVLVGVAAHAMTTAVGRMESNLRLYLIERADVLVSQRVLASAADIPTIEHLENPRYLDRLALLRDGGWALGGSMWLALESLFATAGLLLIVWLLAGVHPAVGLLAVLALLPLLSGLYGQRIIRRGEERAAEHYRHEGRLHDIVLRPASAKELLVTGSGGVLDADASTAWRAAWRAEVRARAKAAGWQAAGWLAYVAGLVGAVYLTARLVTTGEATLGDAVLVVTLGARLLEQVAMAVRGFNGLAEAGHVVGHYRWLRLAATGVPATRPAPDRLRAGITMRGLNFDYPGGRAALRDVDLHLPAGATVALVGDNGAGKSTLVKLLAGLYRPTSGDIDVDGVPLREIAPEAWRRRMSGAFQDSVRLRVSVREAIGVGDLSRLTDLRAVEGAVERAGATGLVRRLPDGLQTQLDSTAGGVELSGGQWQEVAMARSCMRSHPLLLFLDEPTAALDPAAEHRLFDRFVQQGRDAASRAGAITLLVSHRFSTVQNADLVVVMRAGRVVEQGSHDQLLASEGQYARMYRAQADGYR